MWFSECTVDSEIKNNLLEVIDLVRDKYGRTFKTLRVSLLSRCNLGCVYCSLGDNNISNMAASENPMPVHDLLSLIRNLHSQLQLKTIRLTGGEPLLYPHLVQVIEGIREIGINNIKLTTNGFLLERLAQPIKTAGMKSINVSMDAVDEDVFFLMTKRNNVERIKRGIEAAIDAGIEVKINAVLMKGINELQIIPLLEYAFKKNIIIRFLEVMAMGHLHQNSKKYLCASHEILDVIGKRYKIEKLERGNSSTANYWQTEHGHVFGIIANESEPFCHDCDRLRLDSHGNIYGCLSSNHPIQITGINDPLELQEKLHKALLQKQAVRFTGSELSMLDIGG